MDSQLILLIVLALSVVGLIVFAFAGPSAEKAQQRRMAIIRGRHSDSVDAMLEARMRKAISNRTTEDMKLLVSLIPNPENLSKRIRRTGKKWTLGQYMTSCAGIFLVLAAVMALRGYPPFMVLFVSLAAGLGLPHWYIGRLIGKRIDKFTKHFPDALDLLVRGLRSGLPISETLGIVASEIPGPVGEEFKLISERMKIGQTMDQALQETADRLGTAEFQFFVITLAIQRETGGNLAETLSNLSIVLRQRAQMKLKIRAMSSESKASAYIIGSLPFLVFGMISYINFAYMSSFYNGDPNGLFGLSLMQLIGIGGMGWMGIGVFIMAQMINFEI